VPATAVAATVVVAVVKGSLHSASQHEHSASSKTSVYLLRAQYICCCFVWCTAAGLVSDTLSTGMGYTRVGVEPAATFTRFNSPLWQDKLDGTCTYRLNTYPHTYKHTLIDYAAVLLLLLLLSALWQYCD
jgi:hypothetical protein